MYLKFENSSIMTTLTVARPELVNRCFTPCDALLTVAHIGKFRFGE